MGILSSFRFAAGLSDLGDRTRTGIASPWTDAGDDLVPVILDDVLGLRLLPVGRSEAMRVPAMARARNLLTVLVGRLPMHAYTATDDLVDPAPAWIHPTDTGQTYFGRMVRTVDDLLFHGESLWEVTSRGSDGFPLRMAHVDYDEWEVDADARVLIGGRVVGPRDYVYIESFSEGVLDYGRSAIRMASGLDRAALDTAHAPFKLELHQTSSDELTDAEVADLVANARRALSENLGVLFTNAGIQANVHGYSADAMLTEGRNASAIDMARLAGVPAATIDAVLTGSGITYQTGPMLNRQLIDYGAAGFMSAITARLSLDDVTPHGQRVAFDLEAFLGPLPGAAPADFTQDFGGPPNPPTAPAAAPVSTPPAAAPATIPGVS